MRGIKIPLQDFCAKNAGGLMHEGGRICGTLRYKQFIPGEGTQKKKWLGGEEFSEV